MNGPPCRMARMGINGILRSYFVDVRAPNVP